MCRDFKFLLVIILLVTQPAISSSKPQDAATPKTNGSSEQAYITESYRTSISFQANGTSIAQVTAQYRALSAAGVQQLGLLVFSYNSANEQLKIDYVRVLKPDGTVIETPLASVQDMPAEITREAPMYSDYRQRHVPVKGLAVGDLLEYQTEVRLMRPLIPNEFWFNYTFSQDNAVKEEELDVNFPRKKYVQVKSPRLKPVVSQQGDRMEYVWKNSNGGGKKTSQPPTGAGASFPTVEITTFRNWQEVGRWWRGLESKAAVPTPDIRAKAAELTKGLTTNGEKLNAIYHYVSTQIRYISISFGIGRYEPHSAGEVLSNLYGDCKDKHTLLASLLDAVGLNAYPALINITQKIDPDVPSPAQFDHVISAIPGSTQGQNLIWLDTTAEVAPEGFLIRNLRGKQALLIPRNKDPYLIETPADPPFKPFQTFEAEGKLSGDGTFTGKMHSTARNDYGVALRILFFIEPQAQWQTLAQQLSSLSGFGGTVNNVTAGDPAVTDKPFEYSYDYTRKNYGDWANHRIVPAALPLIPLAEWADAAAKTAKPFPLGSPQEITLKSSIKLPAGFTPTLPAAVNLSREFAEYHATYSFKAGVLYAQRELITKQREIPISLRSEYNSFAKAIGDDENQFITLSSGTTTPPAAVAALSPEALQLLSLGAMLVSEKKYSEALPDFEAIAKQSNHNRLFELEFGQVALGAGKIQEGVTALETAVKLDPTPLTLNEVASYLADYNVDLQEAQNYAETAVKEHEGEAAKISLDKLQDDDIVLMNKLGAEWDTLGWVYFREGKFPEAQKYLEAAWGLVQTRVVADHLGQLDEKLGRKLAAIHRYSLAAACPYLFYGFSDPGLTRLVPDEVKRGEDIHRASIELSQLRRVILGKISNFVGSAEFWVLFSPGANIESVKFASGADQLRSATKAISRAHFKVPLPDNSSTKILRRGVVVCKGMNLGCDFTLLTPDAVCSIY